MEDGIFVDRGTMYIAGTRELSEVMQWPLLPLTGKYTTRYLSALRHNFGVYHYVGHSLGGSVAATLAKETHHESTTYGSPKSGSQTVANVGDPVSWFSLLGGRISRLRLGLGHSLRAYGLSDPK